VSTERLLCHWPSFTTETWCFFEPQGFQEVPRLQVARHAKAKRLVVGGISDDQLQILHREGFEQKGQPVKAFA
jgi:hypothetical protein